MLIIIMLRTVKKKQNTITKSQDNQKQSHNSLRRTRTSQVEEARTLDEGIENQLELLVLRGQMP
jgi:hypothetical protein